MADAALRCGTACRRYDVIGVFKFPNTNYQYEGTLPRLNSEMRSGNEVTETSTRRYEYETDVDCPAGEQCWLNLAAERYHLVDLAVAIEATVYCLGQPAGRTSWGRPSGQVRGGGPQVAILGCEYGIDYHRPYDTTLENNLGKDECLPAPTCWIASTGVPSQPPPPSPPQSPPQSPPPQPPPDAPPLSPAPRSPPDSPYAPPDVPNYYNFRRRQFAKDELSADAGVTMPVSQGATSSVLSVTPPPSPPLPPPPLPREAPTPPPMSTRRALSTAETGEYIEAPPVPNKVTIHMDGFYLLLTAYCLLLTTYYLLLTTYYLLLTTHYLLLTT